ncbi:MAG: LysR family transcriptional regulator [Lautropia sp.]
MPSRTDHLLSRLRFRHLQLIVAIDETGSLSSASRVLSLTQPALSKALQEVEGMLGFRLFERGARGLEQTRQGRIVVAGARLLIEELGHLQREARAAGHGAVAMLRLGVSAFLAITHLPPIIARLSRQDPPLLVSVHEDSVPKLFESLLGGSLDALLTVYNPEVIAASVSKALRFERLFEEAYAVIAPATDRLTRLQRVTWDRLLGEPWVLTRKPSLARIFIEECFLRYGHTPPVPVCETGSPVTSAHLVAAGIGLSCVPGTTLREAERGGSIRQVRVTPAPPSAVLGLVYRSTAAAHPRIDRLRAAVSSHAGR